MLKNSTQKFRRLAKWVLTVAVGLAILIFLNIVKTNDIDSFEQLKSWYLKKIYYSRYYSQLYIAKDLIIAPAQFDHPPKTWRKHFAPARTDMENQLFYSLKVWDLESDLKRLDLFGSYLTYFKKSGNKLEIHFKQKRDLPAIRVVLITGVSDFLIQDISVGRLHSRDLDMNKDGVVDLKDVAFVRSTKPYLKNEFTPYNQAARNFRNWTIFDKHTLLKLVNENCNESHKTWDSLFNDRFIKCEDPPVGRIGISYWSLPGKRSNSSKSIGSIFCFSVFFFVFLPPFLYFILVKNSLVLSFFQERSSKRKNGGIKLKGTWEKFKYYILIAICYIGFVYLIYIPLWKAENVAIYNDNLTSVKKYWPYVNPKISQYIVLFFMPDLFSTKNNVVATVKDLQSKNPLELALYAGSSDVVKLLLTQKKYTLPKNALALASGSGSLKTVKYLLDTYHLKITSRAIQCALDRNFMDVGQYLLEKDKDPIHDVDLFVLARSDRLDLFKESHASNNYTPGQISYALCEAIKSYNNTIAKYILDKYQNIENVPPEIHGIHTRETARYEAMTYDNLEILSLLLKRNPSWQ